MSTQVKTKVIKKKKVVKKVPKKSILLDIPITMKNRSNRPYKYAEYLIFIDWTATPRIDRNPETQKEFADKYGINKDTIIAWKKRSEFWSEVRRSRDMDLLDRTGDVLRVLEREALKGDVPAIKLFLQYTGELTERKDVGLGASPELIEALERMRKVLPD